jgi:hypothetical protein
MNLRILVIFSGWMPGLSPDRERWTALYRDILSDDLRDAAKILAFTPGTAQSFETALSDVPGVLDVIRVPVECDTKSDAVGYQFGLVRAAPLVCNFDCVIFLHSKGVSHPYDPFSQVPNALRRDLLQPSVLAEMHAQNDRALYAAEAYLAPTQVAINYGTHLLSLMGHPPAPCIAVTSTIFAIAGSLLADIAADFATAIGERPLLDLGFDKWFFEAIFPSLALAYGGDILVRTPAIIDPSLDANYSYHASPQHNAGLIRREVARWRRQGLAYCQPETPYIFP